MKSSRRPRFSLTLLLIAVAIVAVAVVIVSWFRPHVAYGEISGTITCSRSKGTIRDDFDVQELNERMNGEAFLAGIIENHPEHTRVLQDWDPECHVINFEHYKERDDLRVFVSLPIYGVRETRWSWQGPSQRVFASGFDPVGKKVRVRNEALYGIFNELLIAELDNAYESSE